MREPYPMPTSPAVSAVMRGNRKVDTRPELRLRSALHRSGLRYRTSFVIEGKGLRAIADVAFPGQRLAVFVDGCFWHGCPDHGTRPKANVVYWEAKLRGNQERDRRVDGALTTNGWSVMRIWEHDVVKDLDACVRRVAQRVALGPLAKGGARPMQAT